MRILTCSSTYPPQVNGQSIFTCTLAEGMVKRGHEFIVIAPQIGSGPRIVERNGVKVIYIRALDLRFIDPSLLIGYGYENLVRKTFNSFRPDVVHCQDSAPLSSFIIAEARRRGIKSVATNHPGPEVNSVFNKFSRFLSAILEFFSWRWLAGFLNQADLVTAPSKAAARMVKNRGVKRPVVPVSCGVNLSRFHATPEEDQSSVRKRYKLDPSKVTFIFTGRLDGEKRVDVLIKALKLVNHKDIQVAIAGKGTLDADLQKLAKRLNVHHMVRFLGLIDHDDLPVLLNSADIFIMPGDVESLSLSTLEAMACGIPVIAANSMALPELIEDGVNGYLFAPRNPADLARVMDLMVSNPDRWSEMRKATLERVANHDVERMYENYERLYQALAAQPATGILKSKLRPAKDSFN
jgi:1,2-diacylglycerol 3-alpha-glucosyltransferase